MTIQPAFDHGDATNVIAEFPLSPMQMQLWHRELVTPGDPSLNIAVRWDVEGTLPAEHLQDAFAHVIGRHEILRTRIAERDGAPVQQVMAHAPFKLSQLDIRTTPTEHHGGRIDAVEAEEVAKPFDLSQPGLIRAVLVRTSATRATLLIFAHHIVFDGYSIGVLGREIGTAAAAFQSGKTPDMPELPLQYGDYAQWKQDTADGPAMRAEADYWTGQLANAPYFELDPDLPRPARRGWDADMVTIHLPQDFEAELDAACKRLGVSHYAFGAAITSAVLGRATGTDDLAFATPIACRTEVELEYLIGPFISNQVLRLRPETGLTFRDHAARAHKVVQDALAHPNLPFSKLVELLNPPRSLNRTPLVSVDFMLQPVFMQNQTYGDFTLLSRQSTNKAAARDLGIVLIGRPGGWTLNLLYSTELFLRDRIEHLGQAIMDAFALAFDNQDAPLAAFPGAPAAQGAGNVTPRGGGTATAPAPAPDIEHTLARHWGDLLDRPSASPDENFFETGGHSLLAVRLMARIRDEWDVQLGVATIYEFPTIRQLAGAISDALPTKAPATQTPATADGPRHDWQVEDWQIEPIRSAGTGQKIIAVNEISLTRSMLQHLDGDHPATCVRLFDGTRGLDQSMNSFEDIAAAYAQVIRTHQPEGPYLLFGVCVHGNIALEAARILQSQGAEITGVILKDVWEPGYVEEMKYSLPTRLGEKIHSVLNKIRQVRKGRLSLSAMLGSFRLLRRSGLLHLAAALGLIDRVRRSDLAPEQERFIDYISAARNVYRPAPLSMPVLHVVTSISCTGAGYSPSLGWERVISPGLKTVHLDEVVMVNGAEFGTDRMAAEISQFLSEPWGKKR